MTFEVGDIVELKSGGPTMTVSRIDEKGVVFCVWFNRVEAEWESKAHGFIAGVLRKA